MFDLGSVVAHIKADLTDFKAGMQEAKSSADDLGHGMGGIISGIRGFAEQAAVVVGLQTVAFGGLAKQAIDVAANFEQTQVSFGTMLGSEQKAADLMKELMAFEIHTPFSIETLTSAAKELLGFGIAVDQVVPKLKQFTDISQGNGAKLQELVSIYGEVNAAQQLNGREMLRLMTLGSITYNDIAAYMEKTTGQANITAAQIKKMIESGKISAEDFSGVVEMLTGKGGRFYQENIRQMGTFAGIMSSVTSQFQYAILNILGIDLGAKNEVIKGGLFETLRNLAAQLLDGLNKLQPLFKSLGENKTFQYAIAGLVVALASLVIIIPIVIAVLSPIVLIVAGIELAIIALYVAWNTNFLGIRDITAKIVKEVQNFFNNYLIPLITLFSAFWKENWGKNRQQLLDVWNMIVAIVRIAWDLLYGILKVGIDILTGNWKRAWTDISDMIKGIWNGIVDFFKSGFDAMKDAIVAPFAWAKTEIENIANAIKAAADKINPFHKNSPSLVENVANGVDAIVASYKRLNQLTFGSPQFAGISAGDLNVQNSNPITAMQNTIHIDMNGAILSDANSATQMGEKIGDAIIDKLKLSIRF